MGVQYIVNARRPILAQRTVINFFKKSAIRDICNEENIPSAVLTPTICVGGTLNDFFGLHTSLADNYIIKREITNRAVSNAAMDAVSNGREADFGDELMKEHGDSYGEIALRQLAFECGYSFSDSGQSLTILKKEECRLVLSENKK
ncbi:TPA: hypothetical protein KGE65_003772 [Escherichia coli]|nr:hypothetical protein [Escherichia coli]HBD0198158.1 hypothetical protein [Escherichia coli]